MLEILKDMLEFMMGAQGRLMEKSIKARAEGVPYSDKDIKCIDKGNEVVLELCKLIKLVEEHKSMLAEALDKEVEHELH